MNSSEILIYPGVYLSDVIAEASRVVDILPDLLRKDPFLASKKLTWFSNLSGHKIKQHIKDVYKRLFIVLFDYVSKTPFEKYHVADKAFSTLTQIAKDKKIRPDVIVPLDKVLEIESYISKNHLFHTVWFDRGLVGFNYFFSDEDYERLLHMNYPYIDVNNNLYTKKILNLLNLLHPKYFPCISELIFYVLKKTPSNFLALCASNFLYKYSELENYDNTIIIPYMGIIFENIIQFAWNGDDFDQNDIYDLPVIQALTKTVFKHLTAGAYEEAVITHLKKLVSIISKNPVLFYLVGGIINDIFESYKKGVNKDMQVISHIIGVIIPEAAKTLAITEDSDVVLNIFQCVRHATEFNYELCRDKLIYFAIENMYDIEMTFLSTSCLRIVNALIPHIFNSEHIQDFSEPVYYIIDNIERYLQFHPGSTTWTIGLNILHCISICFSERAVPENDSIYQYFCQKAITYLTNYAQSRGIRGDFETNKMNLNECATYFSAYLSILPADIFKDCLDYIGSILHSDEFNARTLYYLISQISLARPKMTCEYLLPKIQNSLQNGKRPKRMYIVTKALIVNTKELKDYIPSIIKIAFDAINSKIVEHAECGFQILFNLRIFHFHALKDHDMLNPGDIGKYKGYGKTYPTKDIVIEYEEYDPSIISIIYDKMAEFLNDRIAKFDESSDEEKNITTLFMYSLRLTRRFVKPFLGVQYDVTEGQQKYETAMIDAIVKLFNNDYVLERSNLLLNVIKSLSYVVMHKKFIKKIEGVYQSYLMAQAGPHYLNKHFRSVYAHHRCYSMWFIMVDSEFIPPHLFERLNDIILNKIIKLGVGDYQLGSYLSISSQGQDFVAKVNQKCSELILNSETPAMEVERSLGIFFTPNLEFYPAEVQFRLFRTFLQFTGASNTDRKSMMKRFKILVECSMKFSYFDLEDPTVKSFINDLPSLYNELNSKRWVFVVQNLLTYNRPVFPEAVLDKICDIAINTSIPEHKPAIDIIFSLLRKCKSRHKKYYSFDPPEILDVELSSFKIDKIAYKHHSNEEYIEIPYYKCVQEYFKKKLNIEYLEKFVRSVMFGFDEKSDDMIRKYGKGFKQLTSFLDIPMIDKLHDLLIEVFEPSALAQGKYMFIIAILAICTNQKKVSQEIAKAIDDKLLIPLIQILCDDTTGMFWVMVKGRLTKLFKRNTVKRFAFLLPLLAEKLNKNSMPTLNQILQSFTNSCPLQDKNIIEKFIVDHYFPLFENIEEHSTKMCKSLGILVAQLADNGFPTQTVESDTIKYFFENYFDKWPICQQSYYVIHHLVANFPHLNLVSDRIERLLEFGNLPENERKFSFSDTMCLLALNNLIDSIDFFERMKKKSLTMSWSIRYSCNILLSKFLYTHMYTVSNDVMNYFLNDFIPTYLLDDNQNVQLEATENLRMCMMLLLHEEKAFENFAKKCINEMKSKQNIGAIKAVSVIKSLTITNSCPQWLPTMFDEVLKLYDSRHPYAKMFEDTMKDFWLKHLYQNIPEIEEFRYVFNHSYHT